MNDLFYLVAIVLGAYLCSVGFAVAIIRWFFPFKTKEEWEKIRERHTAASQQRVARIRRMASVVKSGQLA